MTIREITEHNEELILCKSACLAENSLGREKEEAPCDIRTCFQRDRDRVIHCSSFRRLKGKTQVFLIPEGDHYRTRLTHTLEVSQIARTAARALRLNEDLTEAASLAHDLGHTPFGHAGERALDSICGHGFHHYEQSLRVCRILERNGHGLNLCREVLDAVLCHTSGTEAKTNEGKLVRICDRIAYVNHDIEDAVRSGILDEMDLPFDAVSELGRTKSERITALLNSVIENGPDKILFSPETEKAFNTLHSFMFEYVYTDPVAKSQEKKAGELVIRLFDYFLRNKDKLPPEYLGLIEYYGLEQTVCDYIAGMTDSYAVAMFDELFIPHGWKLNWR